MSDLLSAPAAVSYNGYPFPANLETLGISGVPYQDSSRRTITYWEYRFHFRFKILASELGQNNTSQEIASIRKRLTRPRGAFSYMATGFGDCDIPALNPAQINWGPFPDLISFRPQGFDQAWEVEWAVVCRVNECDTVVGRILGVDFPIEFNYAISVRKDYAGFQSRSIRGHVIIANISGIDKEERHALHKVDVLKERLTPAVPLMFRRQVDEWSVSQDQLRADFTYVDEHTKTQNPIPPHAVRVDASHVVTNVRPCSMVQLSGTLSGRYELLYDVNPQSCARYFADLIEDRVMGDNALRDMANRKLYTVIPQRIYISQPEIYDRVTGSFSFSYLLVRAKDTGAFEDIQNGLIGLGLWKVLPGTHQSWNEQMTSSVWSKRGYGSLHASGDDFVTDVCARVPLKQGSPLLDKPKGLPTGEKDLIPGLPVIDKDLFDALPPRPPPLGVGGAPLMPGGGGLGVGGAGGADPFFGIGGAALSASRPLYARALAEALTRRWSHLLDPLTSWLDYKLFVHLNPIDDVSLVKPLPGDPVRTRRRPGIDAVQNYARGYEPPYSLGYQSYAQMRNYPTYILTLSGEALRLNYEICPPEILSVGGRPVVPYNQEGDGFTTGVVGNFNAPVVGAVWRFRYLVLGIPGPVGAQENFQAGKPK